MPLPQRVRIDELALSVSAQMLTKSQAVARIANCTSSQTTLPSSSTYTQWPKICHRSISNSVSHPVSDTHSGQGSSHQHQHQHQPTDQTVIICTDRTTLHHITSHHLTAVSQLNVSSHCGLHKQTRRQAGLPQFTLRTSEADHKTGRTVTVHATNYSGRPQDRPSCHSSRYEPHR